MTLLALLGGSGRNSTDDIRLRIEAKETKGLAQGGRLTYVTTAERPGWDIWWRESTGALIDFSAGYTFTLKIGSRGEAAKLTKTTGISGGTGSGTKSAGTPNLAVTFSPGELAITRGVYLAQIIANTGSADRFAEFTLTILDAIT